MKVTPIFEIDLYDEQIFKQTCELFENIGFVIETKIQSHPMIKNNTSFRICAYIEDDEK